MICREILKKKVDDIFTKGRHHKLGIIQCEQCTQGIPHIVKENTDYFVLCPSFSLSSCEYFHRMFLSTLEPDAIKKLCDYSKNLSDDPQNKYIIIADDESITLGYDLHVIPTSSGQNFIIKTIKY